MRQSIWWARLLAVVIFSHIVITCHSFHHFPNCYYTVPGPPTYVQVLEKTVVLWQAPQVPNGNITGYEVRISTTSGQTITTRNIPGSEVLHYVIRENDVADNNLRMAQIEVRSLKWKLYVHLETTLCTDCRLEQEHWLVVETGPRVLQRNLVWLCLVIPKYIRFTFAVR